MPHPIHVRLQHAWAVLCGRVTLPKPPAQIEMEQAMSDLSDAVARVQAAVPRLIALNVSNAQAAAEAAAAAQQSEAQATQALNAVSDSIDAVAPAPATDAGTTAGLAATGQTLDPATGLPVA